MLIERTEALLAGMGYDADAIREDITEAEIEAVIPAKRNRRHPAQYDRTKYKWRNQVERLFNRFKNCRRVATRYDKTKTSYLGFVAIAAYPLSTKPRSRALPPLEDLPAPNYLQY